MKENRLELAMKEVGEILRGKHALQRAIDKASAKLSLSGKEQYDLILFLGVVFKFEDYPKPDTGSAFADCDGDLAAYEEFGDPDIGNK